MALETRRRRYILAAALFVLLLPFAACRHAEEGGNTADSNQTVGVTGSEIKVGTLLPLSGNPAAAWGVEISEGMQAYFDYINDHGGIYGRKLKLIVGDDQYSGPIASEVARKLVEQDGVFAIQGSLGTEAHSAVYKYLEEHGVPDMYILSGNSKWTVPVARNRFCGLVDYITEGRIFARYIYQNFDGRKLGIIAQNDEYGAEGEKGIGEGLQELGANVDIQVQRYDETQTDLTSQVQRLKGAGVDVMAFWGGPVQAANMIKTARQVLSWDVPMMINSTNALEIVAQLAGYDNIEGTVSGMIGHQAWETNIPAIAAKKEIMAKYAPDVPFDNTSLVGYSVSEGLVGLLKQAGPNLTRNAFLDAAESVCNYVSDTTLVAASTSPTDHRFLEGEIMVRATTDKSSGTPDFRWVPFGDVIDFESTKDCVAPTPPPGAEDQPGPSLQGDK
jgi:ABC-type branched-subunit amino acid transport system substrate-binding protein